MKGYSYLFVDKTEQNKILKFKITFRLKMTMSINKKIRLPPHNIAQILPKMCSTVPHNYQKFVSKYIANFLQNIADI